VVGRWLDYKAPNYGRVAVIQSGAALGALAGLALVPALSLDDDKRPITVLGGLNLGLAAGLALAYLPDQQEYGPTWPHVMLVDIAAVTGAVAGALFNTVGVCLAHAKDDNPTQMDACSFRNKDPDVNRRTAQLALVGGGVGLVAGWLLTRNYDKGHSAPSERSDVKVIPMPTILPVQGRDGRMQALPGMAAQGRF
jgi:hypothetical protein